MSDLVKRTKVHLVLLNDGQDQHPVIRDLTIPLIRELADEIERLRDDLRKAAMELNVAGPIPHRIRVLKREHAAESHALRERLEKAKAALTDASDRMLHAGGCDMANDCLCGRNRHWRELVDVLRELDTDGVAAVPKLSLTDAALRRVAEQIIYRAEYGKGSLTVGNVMSDLRELDTPDAGEEKYDVAKLVDKGIDETLKNTFADDAGGGEVG